MCFKMCIKIKNESHQPICNALIRVVSYEDDIIQLEDYYKSDENGEVRELFLPICKKKNTKYKLYIRHNQYQEVILDSIFIDYYDVLHLPIYMFSKTSKQEIENVMTFYEYILCYMSNYKNKKLDNENLFYIFYLTLLEVIHNSHLKPIHWNTEIKKDLKPLINKFWYESIEHKIQKFIETYDILICKSNQNNNFLFTEKIYDALQKQKYDSIKTLFQELDKTFIIMRNDKKNWSNIKVYQSIENFKTIQEELKTIAKVYPSLQIGKNIKDSLDYFVQFLHLPIDMNYHEILLLVNLFYREIKKDSTLLFE